MFYIFKLKLFLYYKIILIYFFLLLFLTEFVWANPTPKVYVNFIFATNYFQAKQFENKQQMLKEIEILNKYFVTDKNKKFLILNFHHLLIILILIKNVLIL
jgi:hypothetical protein